MKVKIFTDTSCDLPSEELVKHQIEMIPSKITFEDGETFLDRFEITPSQFVDKMKTCKKLPKTAAPDPATFVSCFNKGLREADEVIFISLSSGLSSTYQTALLARDLVGSEKIYVFDSLTASLGTGIAAINAAYMADQGFKAGAIIDKLSKMRETKEVLFTLDTLDNVVKGGRLSRFQGIAGNMLNIKPILRGNMQGVPEVIAKVRGRKHAMHRLVDMLGEMMGANVSDLIIGVSHVSCPEEAFKLAQAIKDKYHLSEEIIVSEMGATIGTYAGVGGLMINLSLGARSNA